MSLCRTGPTARLGPICCAICTKPAQFCHFDVPSCFGCRSFFRRSVLQQNAYFCKLSGNCPIEKDAKCRACRFDRCLLKGMNVRGMMASDKIKNEEINAWFNCRRKELLKKKSGNSGQQMLMETQSLETPQKKFCLLESLKFAEHRMFHIRYSETEFPEYYLWTGLMDHITKQDNILAKCESFSMNRRIPKYKQFFLDLIANNWGPNAPTINDKPLQKEAVRWLFIDCFLCIEMTKTIPAIWHLPLIDQTSLLLNNIILTAVFNKTFYSCVNCPNAETLTLPNGFSPIFLGTFNVAIRVFCESIKCFKEINLSMEEFVLLRGMVLLQHASVDIAPASHQILQDEIENFTSILMDYEKIKFGNMMGAKRFAELMFFLIRATKFSIQHRNLVLLFMTTMAQQQKAHFTTFMESVVLGIICANDSVKTAETQK